MRTRNRFTSVTRLVTSLVVVTALAWLSTATAGGVADQSTGSALRFDGVDDYVDLGRGPSFEAHTIEAWVKLSQDPVGDNRNIVGANGAETSSCFTGMGLNLSGGLGGQRFSYSVGRRGCRNDSAIYTDPVTAGVWYHLAGMWDGSAMRFYLDGNLVGTQSVSVFDPFDRMLIGAYWDHYASSETPVGFFPGDVNEIRLWNRARTQAEIRESSCQSLSGLEPGLIGYWRLNEAVGQTVFDLSPSRANGTLGSNGAPAGDSADPRWVPSEVHRCQPPPDTTPPRVQCRPSVNPGGTNPGSTNEDGFFQVSASDQVTALPHMTLGTFVLANGETVKLTQRPGVSGVTLVGMMKPGPNGIKHFLVGPGDAVITARDEAGNVATATCLVPPPPK